MSSLRFPAQPAQIIAKLGRYFAVSLIGTATTLTLLGILVGWANFPPGWSNVIAAGLSTALSFELDLRWVWRRDTRPSFWSQIVPFWVWSLSELAIATVAVSWVGRVGIHEHWQHSTITGLVEVTSIGISLLTWLVQYFLFDRFVFRDRSSSAPGGPASVDRPPGGGSRRPSRIS